MRRLISRSIVFSLFLPFLASAALASPGMVPGNEAAPVKLEGLTVTLELPRTSPLLVGQPLPEGKAPKGRQPKKGSVLLQVPIAQWKYAGLPLATVDGVPVTVGELQQALQPAATPEDPEAESISATGQDPEKVLTRLVDSRVLAREAREIGIDRLPEVRNLVDVYRRQTLRDMLVQKRLTTVKANEKEVEKLYLKAVKEAKIKGVLFANEKEAKAFTQKLKAGGSFETLAKKAAAEKKAELKGGDVGEFVREAEMVPEMAAAVAKVKTGGITGVVKVGDKFAIVKLLETRTPNNPHAREEARQRALNFEQNKALVEYSRSLNKKYVTLDTKLFESLDFKKDFEKLRNDQRAVARIQGEASITVGELAEALKSKYYHGVERAIEQGKIKAGQIEVLNEMVYKRVFVKEALARGIDKTPEFRTRLKEYENSVIFGAFVQKAVIPDIKTTPEDLRAYYDRRVADYTYPEMLGIRSLVFADAPSAQKALDQLKQGTDFRWLEVNAKGQVDRNKEGVLQFGENLLTTSSFPADLRKVLDKVQAGNFRLYGDGKGHFYVLQIEKVVPSRVQPFEEVQKAVLQAVFDEKVQQSLQDWNRKLRAIYPVEVYVTSFNRSQL